MYRFATPVTVLVGLGMPRDIGGLKEASDMLNEWTGQRGASWRAASAAVRSAAYGQISVEEARGWFQAFADKASIAVTTLDSAFVAAALDQDLAA